MRYLTLNNGIETLLSVEPVKKSVTVSAFVVMGISFIPFRGKRKRANNLVQLH